MHLDVNRIYGLSYCYAQGEDYQDNIPIYCLSPGLFFAIVSSGVMDFPENDREASGGLG